MYGYKYCCSPRCCIFPLQGPTGAAGPAGPAGPEGVQGIRGLIGPTGVRGAQGDTGPIGLQGPIGPQGIQGLQGLQGPAGPQGVQGENGLDGVGLNILASYDTYAEFIAAHPTGSPGEAYLVDGFLYVWSSSTNSWENVGYIRGPQGIQGIQGPQGIQGEVGPTGPAGLQGIQGEQGSPGAEGAAGPTGPQGLQGIQGEPGAAGQEGPAGPIGLTGEQGPTGPQGIQGIQGVTGPQGEAGPTGPTGAASVSPTTQNATLAINPLSLANNTLISYTVLISNGSDIIFPSNTAISLASERVYLISYIVNAELDINSEITITPRVNGVDQPSFSSLNETGSTLSTASTSATFLLNTVLYPTPVTLSFAYYGSATGLNPVGSISIVEVT